MTSGWKYLFEHQLNRPAIRFVAGMRHSVHPSWYTRHHRHEHIEAVFHPSGRGVTRVREEAVPFKEGSVVIYGVDEMHDQTITHSGEDLCLQWAVPRKFAPSGVLYLPRLSDHYLVSEFHCLSRPATPIDATQQTLLDWRAASVLLNLLKLALARADDQPGETHVVKAEEFIQSRFKVIRSINEVAAYVHLSPTHLRYLFKKLRGITLINYLTEVRVERARSLLTYSGLPLKQIATECGFSDEYYFSTVFQRHTHVPPGKFRRGG